MVIKYDFTLLLCPFIEKKRLPGAGIKLAAVCLYLPVQYIEDITRWHKDVNFVVIYCL